MAQCKAVVNIHGEHFACDTEAPHSGLAHTNQQAQALWCSDGEAKRAIRKQKSDEFDAVAAIKEAYPESEGK